MGEFIVKFMRKNACLWTTCCHMTNKACSHIFDWMLTQKAHHHYWDIKKSIPSLVKFFILKILKVSHRKSMKNSCMVFNKYIQSLHRWYKSQNFSHWNEEGNTISALWTCHEIIIGNLVNSPSDSYKKNSFHNINTPMQIKTFFQ